jgi:hypothetical protein
MPILFFTATFAGSVSRGSRSIMLLNLLRSGIVPNWLIEFFTRLSSQKESSPVSFAL